MISESDLQDYLRQIMSVDQRLQSLYGRLSVEVTAAPYRRIFQKLISEEQKHEVHLQTLVKMLAQSPEGNKSDLGNCTHGHPAPAFSAQAAVNNRIVNVTYANGILKVDHDVLKGRYLILFFYPMDFEFVCPTEILAFDDAMTEFDRLKTSVLGISVDSAYTHLSFMNTPREKRGIGKIHFPLVSDVSRRISRDYGVLLDTGVSARGTFLIDDKGILQAMSIHNLKVGRSIADILRCLKAYQTAMRTGESCPAEWTPGETTITRLIRRAKPKG